MLMQPSLLQWALIPVRHSPIFSPHHSRQPRNRGKYARPPTTAETYPMTQGEEEIARASLSQRAMFRLISYAVNSGWPIIAAALRQRVDEATRVEREA